MENFLILLSKCPSPCILCQEENNSNGNSLLQPPSSERGLPGRVLCVLEKGLTHALHSPIHPRNLPPHTELAAQKDLPQPATPTPHPRSKTLPGHRCLCGTPRLSFLPCSSLPLFSLFLSQFPSHATTIVTPCRPRAPTRTRTQHAVQAELNIMG